MLFLCGLSAKARRGNPNTSTELSQFKSNIKSTIFFLSALTESLPSWPDPKIETKENKSVKNQGSLIIGLGSIDSLLINFQLV
jgi:hypothetical protein